jgi:hypothetical protein
MDFKQFRLLYKLISKNKKLSEKRHPMFDRNRFMKIFTYGMIAFTLTLESTSINTLTSTAFPAPTRSTSPFYPAHISLSSTQHATPTSGMKPIILQLEPTPSTI